MTNHYIDFQWSDVTLIMGANPAANHPISFKWITKAMERGGKLVCVDPRFTQSAAKAHLYAPLRSGTDIAFLGGMIKYIFDNKLFFEEYVKRYTNATFLVNPDFKMPGDNKGASRASRARSTTRPPGATRPMQPASSRKTPR